MSGEAKALVAYNEFQRGSSLVSILNRGESFTVEIEVMDGLRAEATPYFEDGEVHLAGEIDSKAHGGKVKYHVSTDPATAENMIRDAVANNLPLRIASWFNSNFGRLPAIKRVMRMPRLAATAEALPSRRLCRRF